MNQYRVAVNGKELDIELISRSQAEISFRCSGQLYAVAIQPVVIQSSVPTSAVAYAPAAPAMRSSAKTSSAHVVAPMPGIVTKILVKEGDEVSPGQLVAAIEAMKMENNIAAPRAAKVKRILTSPGAEVQNQQILIELV
jgi:biotin carboxyl carrier protein